MKTPQFLLSTNKFTKEKLTFIVKTKEPFLVVQVFDSIIEEVESIILHDESCTLIVRELHSSQIISSNRLQQILKRMMHWYQSHQE